MKKYFIPMSIAGAAALVLLAGAPAYSAEGPSEEQIQNAKTAADHNAIADAYDAQAKELQAKSTAHKNMERPYLNPPYSKSPGSSFEGHCKRLAATYGEAAKESSELAAAHRKMAAQAK